MFGSGPPGTCKDCDVCICWFACLVAATSSGLTPCAAGWCIACAGWPGTGVLVPPVCKGVEKLDGSSEVKIVAVEGDRVYLVAKVDKSACVKPGLVSRVLVQWLTLWTYLSHAPRFQGRLDCPRAYCDSQHQERP